VLRTTNGPVMVCCLGDDAASYVLVTRDGDVTATEHEVSVVTCELCFL